MRRATWVLVALGAVWVSGGCATKVVDYEDEAAANNEDWAGATETWTGYIENYQFASGSDAVAVVFESRDATSVTGTVVFGEGTPPAMNPCIGYPPTEDGMYDRRITSRPMEGFPFTQRAGRVQDGRVRFAVSLGEQWGQWCEQQASYLVNSELGYYSCVPGEAASRGPGGCRVRSAELESTVFVDCGTLELCQGLSVCDCDASGCSAAEVMRITFDLHPDGQRLVGSVADLDGQVRNLRLTRAADTDHAAAGGIDGEITIMTIGCVGDPCDDPADCTSGVCVSGSCQAPSCSDGVLNGYESDIDCGHEACGIPCMAGMGCRIGNDCWSWVCVDGRCQAPPCGDGVKNGRETDVDCGGLCDPCGFGQACEAPADCDSWVCELGTCGAPTCSDGYLNAEETDVDCGGACAPCGPGQDCKVAADCENGSCLNGVCQDSDCTDGAQNGTESDIDCGGGSCAPCEDGRSCAADTDCQSRSCSADSCQPPTCSDGVLNGAETDVDCGGGECGRCTEGQRCLRGTDCDGDSCLAGECLV
jgi:hypothetical protein